MTAEEPGYRVEFDATLNIVKIILAGLWTGETLAAYQSDAKPRSTELGGASPTGALIDMRQYAVQTQDVVNTIKLLIESRGRSGHPHAFLLSSSAIQKLQLERIASEFDTAAFFKDEGEALAWLADQRRTR